MILFLLVQTGLNELGFWQLSRAKEKQVRLAKIADSGNENRIPLNLVTDKSVKDFVRVSLTGELKQSVNFLVENKIQSGKLGYHVLNLVEDTATGLFVLVNRGWVEGKANRENLPSIELPPRSWTLSGRIYPINQDILSSKAELEDHGKIVRMPVMDIHILSLLEKRYQIEILPYLIRLDEKNEGALNVKWSWVSMTPEKHLGYAFQWFALALVFLIASFVALFKTRKEN